MFDLDPDEAPPSAVRRRGTTWWALGLGLGALGAVIALVVALATAGRETWLQLHLLASGVAPWAVTTQVTERVDFTYAGSPWQAYLEVEARFVEVDRTAVQAFADDISDEVALRLLAHTGHADLHDAERALWAEGSAGRLPVWIAEALRSRGVFYHQESLLSRSFDPDLHRDDTVHLDCDQLVHLMGHVAWRLDLDMAPIPSPHHIYLVYRSPGGGEGSLYLEATSFRSIERRGDIIDMRGQEVGESFFIDEDHYRSGKGGSWADPEYASAVGYYEPMDQRALDDSIVANVLVGVELARDDVDVVPLLRSRLQGTRNELIATNLWLELTNRAQDALDAGAPGQAMDLAREAIALRASHGQLINWQDPREQLLAARAANAQGHDDIRDVHVEALLASYEEDWRDHRVAMSAVHADGLLLAASRRRPSLSVYNDFVLPVANFETRSGSRTRHEQVCELAIQSLGRAFRPNDLGCDRE